MEKPLWSPSKSRVENSNMYAFLQKMKAKYGFPGEDFQALHRWSVENLEDFWLEIWLDAKVKSRATHQAVLTDRAVLTDHSMPSDRLPPNEVWFPGVRFNFARQMLRYRDNRPAIKAESEGKPRRTVSYRELYSLVARCQAGLKALGVKKGDRVAGFLPNTVEPVVAMLATAALGAVWSSTSPDFGFQGVMDRFGQIKPKVLLCTDGYRYNGKSHHTLEKAARIAREIPTLEKTVIVPFLDEEEGGRKFDNIKGAISWEELLNLGEEKNEIEFADLPFDHPLLIAYSSGTTGRPKCLLHGAGGTLLKHHLELKFQVDLSRDDTLFYFSTCGWMMWNWMVSGLAQGAAIVTYDGSPVYPDQERLFQLAEENGITVFGTSPKFLGGCQKAGLKPGKSHDLSQMRSLLSTGAPLEKSQFHYVYEAVKADLQLASISGGTDIIGCFMAGNPLLPVYAGEIQGAVLGVDLAAYDGEGQPVIGEKGELVCRNPIPSMPVGFWKDPQMEQYRQAYFQTYPGQWRHGDFITINQRGGIVVHGRSDATLNPGGVRIGTAEIYRIVEELPFVQDSLVVGQQVVGEEGGVDVRVVLFVVIASGKILDEAMRQEIKTSIRNQATPRHLPAIIHQISEVPVTINGKKVELAVGNMLRGEPVTNREALANPEALQQFKNLFL